MLSRGPCPIIWTNFILCSSQGKVGKLFKQVRSVESDRTCLAFDHWEYLFVCRQTKNITPENITGLYQVTDLSPFMLGLKNPLFPFLSALATLAKILLAYHLIFTQSSRLHDVFWEYFEAERLQKSSQLGRSMAKTVSVWGLLSHTS